MSAAQRNKGRRGQGIFAAMLTERDWVIDPITAGVQREDIIATDPAGRVWSVEVKNTKLISPQHKVQAMQQAKTRRLPWMLANKIHGTSSWLVQRQGERPVVWHERETA